LEVIKAESEEKPGHEFKEEPDTKVWIFSHCPIETKDPEMYDNCEGCPGWGIDMGEEKFA
jgi:hypothetical protein